MVKVLSFEGEQKHVFSSRPASDETCGFSSEGDGEVGAKDAAQERNDFRHGLLDAPGSVCHLGVAGSERTQSRASPITRSASGP